MMTRQLPKILAAIALLACSGQASAIMISASGGTNASETISDVTIGNQLTVTYQFTEAYAGDDGVNWPTFLARLFGPCCNNLFQDSRNAATGAITRTIDTSAFANQIRDLRFDINLFNDVTAFATVRVLDILVDGQSIGVPEPAPLVLLAIGLLGLVAVRRKRTG